MITNSKFNYSTNEFLSHVVSRGLLKCLTSLENGTIRSKVEVICQVARVKTESYKFVLLDPVFGNFLLATSSKQEGCQPQKFTSLKT